MVYFLGVGDPAVAVKIGMLSQAGAKSLGEALARRLAAIQSGNHEHVQVLAVIPFSEGEYPTRDAETMERELHLQFESHGRFHRGTRGAEWFDADPDLLSHVLRIARPPEVLGLPRSISQSRSRQRP
jgi:hypothetical protein